MQQSLNCVSLNLTNHLEKWLLGDHLCKDGAERPDIQWAGILGGAKQHFWGPVCEMSSRNSFGSRIMFWQIS